MSIKRLKKLEHLEDFFLLKVYEHFTAYPKDGLWRDYKATYDYKGKRYDVQITARIERENFSYRNYKVNPHEIVMLDFATMQPTLSKREDGQYH